MFSIPHMIVIFVVVLVVFGPQKLPELARGLGKLMAEFRKASTDFRSAFEQEMRDLERQAVQAERKKQADAAAKAAAEVEQPVTQGSAEGAEKPMAELPADTRATEGSAGLEPVVAPVPEAVPHSTDSEQQAVANGSSATDAAEDRSIAGERGDARESIAETEPPLHDLHRPA